MSGESVLFRASPGGVGVITLNRPEVHNAFDDETIARLAEVLADVAVADGIRAVLIESTGKSFCAGADLNWMKRTAEAVEEANLEDARVFGAMLRRLDTLPQPTIALVQGPAYGGGVGIMAACDIVVAAKEAAFSLSEVRLGLIPATIAPYVVGAIGARNARRYFLTAERFSAIEAHRMGLVHQLVDGAGELAGVAEQIVAQIFAGAPVAVAHAKALIADVDGLAIDAGLVEDLAQRIARARASEEGREGVAAFLEKRTPAWRD